MSRSASLLAVVLLACALSCLARTSLAEMLVGGVSEVHHAVSPEAARAAEFAVQALSQDAGGMRSSALGSNAGGELSLLAIESVQTQVVAGVNYVLTLKVADSANGGTPHLVKVTVWSRPWLEDKNTGEPAWQLTHAERL